MSVPFNITELTLNNTYYRHVINTAEHSQLVLMSITEGDEIGMETHKDTDQFIRIESGNGVAVLDEKQYRIKDDSAFSIHSGVKHNIINTGFKPLKLYTLYSPPHHPPNTLHMKKSDDKEEEVNSVPY